MYKIISRIFKNIHWSILTIGLIITILTSGLYIFKPAYIKFMEYKLYDIFFQKVYSKNTTNSVAIVDIDEYSLEKFGQWPWPRYRIALLLQKIHAAGAIAVGIDILFAEPDGTSPAVLKKILKRDLQVDIEFSGLPSALLDNDELFSSILQKGPYVLGYSFYFEGDNNIKTKSITPPFLSFAEVHKTGAAKASDYLWQAVNMIQPMPIFLKKADNAGYMNTITDRDGVLRQVPLFICWHKNIYPQLALATLLTAFKNKIPVPIIKVTRGGIESIKIGDTIVPLKRDGTMLLNYRGPSHTFPYISAGKLLQDKVNPKKIKGKIIFLGSSASGLYDTKISPLDQVFPGVEVHATIVDNILSQDFIHRPDWIPGLELISIIVWGIIITLLIGWANSELTLTITLISGVISWYGGLWALKHLNIWLSPFFLILTLILNFSILNMLKFWFSEKKRRFFRSAFSQYVSKAVVDQIAKSPEKLSLQGEEKDMTILFSDIRSFTTISESLSPSQITMLLHDYFTPMTRTIIKNHGTLDKFIGDAVMCFWNAPVNVNNHKKFAVKAALEMLDALDELNKTFMQKYGLQINIGIGIHTGVCRVGNMGSADLFDYTIIGDNVNLASRLEGLSKFYGVKLVVSEAILKENLSNILTQELDFVRVKGKIKPIRIYTVYSSKNRDINQLQNELKLYHQALKTYKKKDFNDAKKYFNELTISYPEKKLYQFYKERCAFFIKNCPDENWDGVFTHTSK